MKNQGTRFINEAVPKKFTKTSSGKVLVEYSDNQGGIFSEEFDTVVLAIGRYADSVNIGLDKLGVQLAKNGKVITNDEERSSVDNIFAIGDCAEGRPELTPPAIMAGKLLAARLFGNSNVLMDYKFIATTVFTPLEYGCVGFSEEEAIAKFGKDNIKTYHSEFKPLEWNFNLDNPNNCYLKLVTDVSQNEKVLGFHILSPNAGEITQGVALAVKMGVTKSQLDQTVGIHPTVAEEFTSLTAITGEDAEKEGC
jgi:thioredoxin reductase (NADPH)